MTPQKEMHSLDLHVRERSISDAYRAGTFQVILINTQDILAVRVGDPST